MTDKIDIYDTIGILVPGILLVCIIPVAFPNVVSWVAPAKLPDTFAFIGLVALSFFLGNLMQALASAVEPFLYWTWGGRPSERALREGLGDRFFPPDSAKRIRTKLVEAVGNKASDRSLFLFAMQRAESCGSVRVSRFNALYGYHRLLFVLTGLSLGLFVFSFWGGLAARLTWQANFASITLLLLLLILFWHRARQRGYYYVREVLLCAEQNIIAPGTVPKR